MTVEAAIEPVTMPVERGKIREYAIATANRRPEYLDDERAPIPPTFLSTVVFWNERIPSAFESPEAQAAFAEAGIARDWGNLLSLEQEYLFHGPLPRAGDVLELRQRFDGVERKVGKRGGEMLLVRFAFEFHEPGGALRAECRYTSAYLRSAASSSSSPSAATPHTEQRSPEDIDPGDLPFRRFGPISMTDIVRYQGASGDMNPIHHDDDFARSAGYREAFSVGMLSAGYLATACTDRFGVESVRRFRTRFRELVWRGESLTATGTIERRYRAEAGDERAVVGMAMVIDGGRVAVEGDAEFALSD